MPFCLHFIRETFAVEQKLQNQFIFNVSFVPFFFSLLSIGGIIGSPPFYSRCGSEIIESFRIYRINRINLVDGMWSLLIRQCGVITGGHKTDEQCLQWECALNYSQNTPPATSECLFPET